MKIITFNANGIRSAARKNFYQWLASQRADVVCIQETKAHHMQLSNDPLYFPEGYYCQYVDAEKKGYSGVAIYSRIKPSAVVTRLGFDSFDTEGRYLQFDYPNLSVISLYLPSGSSGETRQVVKFDCLEWFAGHLMTLKKTGKPLIICGDFNIAHKVIDIKNWRSNQRNSGFLPEERAWMDALLNQMGFVDAFRVCNQMSDEYTWWSNRGQARANNVGWRIDYQIISESLREQVDKATIYRDEMMSDHAPLVIQYKGNLDD